MTTYNIRNGYQLRTDRTTTSRVLVHAEPASGNAKIFQNTTAILSTGDFSATELWEDATGAGRGRFAPNAYGLTYCNGVESCIYSGDELFIPALFQLSLDSTELMPDADREFSGTPAWANVDINAYDETGDLTITASAADQYCTCPVLSIPTTIGQPYRLTSTVANIASTWTVTDFTGVQTLGTVTANGTQFIDFVASTTGGLRIVAAATDSSGDFDDFSLKALNPSEKTKEISNTLQTTGEYITWAGATTSAVMIFSDRPLQGIKAYVKSANSTAAVMSGMYHKNDGLWTVLTLTDNTSASSKTLAATGTVTFTSTVSDAAPFHYQGMYLYAYLFSISAGSGEVYYITVDAPFQKMQDIWDGVYRVPIAYQFYNTDKYDDFTYDVNYDSTANTVVGAIIDGLDTSDSLTMTFEEQVAAVQVKMLAGRVNKVGSILTVQYWNGSAWTTVSGMVDGTSTAGASHGQTGLIYWLKPTDEVKQNLFNRPGYSIKFTFSVKLTGTQPTTTYVVVVDRAYGVPAQQKIRPFKFAGEYLGRTLLLGHTAGKEGNRIDYSLPDAPLTFNGEETSRDGTQSIYVSGGDDLEASGTLTNRYGSSIIAVHVLLKRTEAHILFGSGPSDYVVYPISPSTGCIAPLTFFTAEVAFGVGAGDESKRNICGWLSNDGPVLFDGTVLIPIGGIRKYFDPADDDYINLSYADRSISYFNAVEKVWNLLIPTGASTTNDAWLCFDLMRPKKGWFEKIPTSYPQTAFPVVDANGGRHIYGSLDTGYMVQLDYGTSWAGTKIDQVIETGDYDPSGDMFQTTNISEVRVVAKKMTEDQDITVKHYSDTVESGAATLGVIALDAGSNRLVRDTIDTNKTAWMHRMRFEGSTVSTDKGIQLIGWAYKWTRQTEDPK